MSIFSLYLCGSDAIHSIKPGQHYEGKKKEHKGKLVSTENRSWGMFKNKTLEKYKLMKLSSDPT